MKDTGTESCKSMKLFSRRSNLSGMDSYLHNFCFGILTQPHVTRQWRRSTKTRIFDNIP
ncbi:hypothetical protein L9F63_007868, partial [Diploptera punctata]